jgi:signal transduction histidine kinase
MLATFLEENRVEILALAEEKTLRLAGSLSSSPVLRQGLPIFYEHLIHFLKSSSPEKEEKDILFGAAGHGTELLRLNYTLSHVVHAYGAMCQAITEFAMRRNIAITSQEFNDLNLCLDIAIASAVSEFQYKSVKAIEEREVQHLGFLVHELRNALSSATIAHEMIKQGLVGTGGSTARVLENNLILMRNLIDRSLSEIRMRADPELHIEKFSLLQLIDQIFITATNDAKKRRLTLINEIENEFELVVDRQLLLSALANLVQNALKYTKAEGRISLRARASGLNIVIEVENECEGLDPSVMKNIFQPFVSGVGNNSGLGLGLTIVQRAVTLLQGTVSAHNLPGVGCSFQLEFPMKISPIESKKFLPSSKSAQPSSSKK